MKAYKEVARIPLFHNGKKYEAGETVRERVMLTDAHVRVHKEAPELSNCDYVLIGEKEPEKKADKKVNIALWSVNDLIEKAKEMGIPLTGEEKKPDLIKLINSK